jgi:TPR repeat protein
LVELAINWNPLVRRDFESFRKLALGVDDERQRELALLKAGGVIDALMGEIIRAGYFSDQDTLANAERKYRKACEDGLETKLRKHLFQEVTAFTQHFDDCAATTYLPFILEDDDAGIVSTATLDYVSVGKIPEGADPMLLPRHTVELLGSRVIRNRGAVFGGLLNTGDPRVCELLWETRSTLTQDEINQACICNSGFIGSTTVEFYLRWLEEIVHSGRDDLFGKLASGLALIRRNVQTEFVFTGYRPFPYSSLKGEELRASLKPVPLDDYTREIAPRMLKLAFDEPQPKVMPEVLTIWGICTLVDAKGILIVDDLTERCWEALNNKEHTADECYASLARLVDVGISLGGNVIDKVAATINRRGRSRFWEIVLDRYELSLEFREHQTASGPVFGQIIAMPIICSTEIPDEQIPDLCAALPDLPLGDRFKFIPTAVRWGELHGNEEVNRLLHTMLYRWKTGDAPDIVERDFATIPPLNDTKSPVDEIIVSQYLAMKVRFLVGYRLASENEHTASNDQRDSWVSSANAQLDQRHSQSNAQLDQRHSQSELFVRYPSPLVSALYAGQAAMMSYVIYSTLNTTESRYSSRDAEQFGLRIECFGDSYSQLARWFTVTSYDLESGESIARRDISIALPSTTSRWSIELDQLRMRAEKAGYPYVIKAPILQPTQLHPAVFEQTKCIKIILGAPAQFEKEYSDTLSSDPNTHLPGERERWAIERETLPRAVDEFSASVASALDIETDQLHAWGTYTVEKERWLPVVVLLFEEVKRKDGSEIDWPPPKGEIEPAIALATTLLAARKWSKYEIGGLGVDVRSEDKAVEEVLAEARAGDLDAQLAMAEMLFEGQRVPVDLHASLQWYRLAAQKGKAGAQAMVGYMLEQGMGCDPSDSEAFHWFRLGAENGDPYCQYKYAKAFEEGLHTAKNVQGAIGWYRAAAEQGHAGAQFELGLKLYWSEDGWADLEAAVDLFEKSARQGELAAQYHIGIMLANGEGTEIDRVAGYAWLRLAAEQGDEDAEGALADVSAKMEAEEIEAAKAYAKRLSKEIS